MAYSRDQLDNGTSPAVADIRGHQACSYITQCAYPEEKDDTVNQGFAVHDVSSAWLQQVPANCHATEVAACLARPPAMHSGRGMGMHGAIK